MKRIGIAYSSPGSHSSSAHGSGIPVAVPATSSSRPSEATAAVMSATSTTRATGLPARLEREKHKQQRERNPQVPEPGGVGAAAARLVSPGQLDVRARQEPRREVGREALERLLRDGVRLEHHEPQQRADKRDCGQRGDGQQLDGADQAAAPFRQEGERRRECDPTEHTGHRQNLGGGEELEGERQRHADDEGTSADRAARRGAPPRARAPAAARRAQGSDRPGGSRARRARSRTGIRR